MYPNNNMNQYYQNYPTNYQDYNNFYSNNNEGDRLVGGGLLGPLLLGGIAGYAIGRPNYYQYPYNYNYNNYYYYPYYQPYFF